jgi:hypothetical protein
MTQEAETNPKHQGARRPGNSYTPPVAAWCVALRTPTFFHHSSGPSLIIVGGLTDLVLIGFYRFLSVFWCIFGYLFSCFTSAGYGFFVSFQDFCYWF